MTQHVEIESTFDVAASFVLPDLLRLPGVATVEQPLEQHLEAEYVDTPDLRLLRARITLRRRTGGDDAGWHLKLPVAMVGGRSARLEVHRPLGRSRRTVPPQLARLVRVRVREAPLVPAARLTTLRRVSRLLDVDGLVLAEVADDQVLAEAFPAERGGEVVTSSWREIEVELVKGDDVLLAAAAKRLRGAGARPAAIGSKVARALQSRLAAPGAASAAGAPSQPSPGPKRGKAAGRAPVVPPTADLLTAALQDRVDRVLGWDPHVRAETPGAVLDLRLATRELRSLLAGLAPVLPRSQSALVRPGLRRLGGLLGEVRTAEILHERVVAAIAGLPPDLIIGPVTRRADADFSLRSREALSALHAELESAEYFALVDGLEVLAAQPVFSGRARQPADAVLAGLVREHLRKLGTAVEAFTQDVAEASRTHGTSGWVLRAHEIQALRSIGRTVKRARYVTEVAVPVVGRGAAEALAALIALQNAVSRQRDGAAMRAALRELGLHASMAGQNAFTFGLLHGLELAGDASHLDDVPTHWRAIKRAARAWPA